MEWKNLVNNECPKCGNVLVEDNKQSGVFWICSTPTCDFIISAERKEEISSNIEGQA